MSNEKGISLPDEIQIMFAHSREYNYICGKLNFTKVFCIIGYVFIHYVKQCFANIVAQLSYAICNVEIEVDRLEQNGGNVLGVLRPTMEIQRVSPWTNVKPLYGYESYPRRLMWQWARLFNRKKRKNTAVALLFVLSFNTTDRSVSASLSLFETFRQYNASLILFRFNSTDKSLIV